MFKGVERFDVSTSGRALRVRAETPSFVSAYDCFRRKTRGSVRTFSDDSRSRMMLAANRLPDGVHLLVTLTYPAIFPEDIGVVRGHRRAFFMRLRRAYPAAVVLWKLEFQRRGAPHYHLIVANSGASVGQMREWVRRAWYEVVASGDERHLRAGTQVDQLRSSVAYLGGYLKKVGASKSYQDLAPVWAEGLRRWGIVGVPWEVVAVGLADVVACLRYFDALGVAWLAWSPSFLLSLFEAPAWSFLVWEWLDP